MLFAAAIQLDSIPTVKTFPLAWSKIKFCAKADVLFLLFGCLIGL